MKNNFDFTTEIPHHEDESAVLKVSITNYSDGTIMSITADPKLTSMANIILNRKELETLLALLDRYDDAQKIMNGGAV